MMSGCNGGTKYKIKNKSEELGLIVEHSINEVYIFDPDDKCFNYVNQSALNNIGYNLEEMYNMTPLDIKIDFDEESFNRLVEPLVDGSKDHFIFETIHRRKNGTKYNVEVHIQKIAINGSKKFVVIAHDITERVKSELKLKLLAQAMEQMDELVRITDKDGNITYVNDACVIQTGYKHRELIGENVSMFYSGHQDKEFYENLWITVLSGKTYNGVLINRKKNQDIYYEEETITPMMDKDNNIEYFVVTSRDITERFHLEEKLQRLASIDCLTGICNRHKTNEELDIEIARAKRYKNNFALAMFDIDNFKVINDTYGHDVGDYVLKELTKVILAHMRESDRFGRWGGEEFILILPSLIKEQAVDFTEILREKIAKHKFEGVHQVTVSFGVTVFNEDDTKESLLKRVDNALYESKEDGRNKVRFL